MALPQLLLVDDSEAILAYEKAALAPHYEIATACNGEEAIAQVAQIKPALVVLDLSMPKVDGEDVLNHIKSSAELRDIPVVIVSAERDRALACYDLGATEVIIKPVRATELLAVVNRVIQEREVRKHHEGLTVVAIEAGGLMLGITANLIRGAILQPALTPLPLGPKYLCQVLEYRGEAIGVLDLPARFGRPHTRDLLDRKILLLHVDNRSLGLCVDEIHHPQLFPATAITHADNSWAVRDPVLQNALVAVIKTDGDHMLPVLNPEALLSRRSALRLEGLTTGAQSA